MKKVVFSIGGKRFEVDLENDFAEYVHQDLAKNDIGLDRDNAISKLLQVYLKAIKKDYDSEQQIQTLLNDMVF